MNKNKNILIQLIFWVLFFLLTNRFIAITEDNNFRSFIYSVVIVLSFMSISYLNMRVFVPKFLIQKKHTVYIAIILVVLILTPLLFIQIDLIHLPFEKNKVINKNQNIVRGKFLLVFFITSLFIFVSTIIRLALDFSKKEKQRIQIEKERLLIETKYLRSQMNPHFFLNALNNLQSINRLFPQQSEKYINTLAEMMRYVTYDCTNNKVSIQKEIGYIKNYIYFQQIKDEDIRVIYKTDIENEETQIEPMLLMPFIENAFKYGVLDNTENPIYIYIQQDKSGIYFNCKNAINHKAQSNSDPSYSGLGIKNVKERLQVNYPNNHSLQIESDDNNFIISLRLN